MQVDIRYCIQSVSLLLCFLPAQKLHLPPELSETTSRSQEDPAPNLKQSGCMTSTGRNKLDFWVISMGQKSTKDILSAQDGMGRFYIMTLASCRSQISSEGLPCNSEHRYGKCKSILSIPFFETVFYHLDKVEVSRIFFTVVHVISSLDINLFIKFCFLKKMPVAFRWLWVS